MTEHVTRDQIIEVFQEIAPEADMNVLIEHSSFRDQYEIDSVDFLNFILTLEKYLSIKIPEMDYPKCSSVAGCIDYLNGIEQGSELDSQ